MNPWSDQGASLRCILLSSSALKFIQRGRGRHWRPQVIGNETVILLTPLLNSFAFLNVKPLTLWWLFPCILMWLSVKSNEIILDLTVP